MFNNTKTNSWKGYIDVYKAGLNKLVYEHYTDICESIYVRFIYIDVYVYIYIMCTHIMWFYTKY